MTHKPFNNICVSKYNDKSSKQQRFNNSDLIYICTSSPQDLHKAAEEASASVGSLGSVIA